MSTKIKTLLTLGMIAYYILVIQLIRNVAPELQVILIDATLIITSVIVVNVYLSYIKRKYGRKPSISASAKNVKVGNRSPLFYGFITIGLCVPFGYVGGSYLTTAAAMLLFGIGMVTGYNPDLNPKEDPSDRKIQDWIHIALVNVAIGAFVVGVILLNHWLSIVIGIAAIPVIWMLVKKVEHHIWKVEVVMIYAVWVSLTIERVILPSIEYARYIQSL